MYHNNKIIHNVTKYKKMKEKKSLKKGKKKKKISKLNVNISHNKIKQI